MTPLQWCTHMGDADVARCSPQETDVRKKMIKFFRKLQVRSWNKLIQEGNTSWGGRTLEDMRPTPFWDPVGLCRPWPRGVGHSLFSVNITRALITPHPHNPSLLTPHSSPLIIPHSSPFITRQPGSSAAYDRPVVSECVRE